MTDKCVIYNFEQRYREGIFRLIEEEWHPQWIFGDSNENIAPLPDDLLPSERVKHIHNVRFGPFYWQQGVVGQIRNYDTLLMLGELYCLSTWVILLLRHTLFTKKRVFLWSHGWYGKESLIKRIIKQWFFSLSDATFLYGHHAEKTAQEQGYKKDNLLVIHNSLNYELQRKIRDRLKPSNIYTKHFGNNFPVLIFIGRLTPIKRLDQLITALALLHKRGSDYNLVFVGEGSEYTYLQKMIQEKDLSSRVWFYGSCYDESVNAELLYNADLCIAPGNVGLTAMHSMVYGTPVMTHNDKAWQMPEFEAISAGQTGDFFIRNNVEDMANKIDLWFEKNKDIRERIRRNCFNEIDTSWTPAYQMNILKQQIK